jgi:polygalacturonase
MQAQDTRSVAEPVIPPSCTVLKAQLHSAHGDFSNEDETRLDTKRIQEAIDRCGNGQAVELATDGANNAFLSGPLHLHADETLLVDKEVTLYASRNPKDYEISPGSCGVVNNEKQGCKPFISAKRADNVGIMGDGIIDGRGGAKMLGSRHTWWDLAQQVKSGGSEHQQVPRLIDTDYTNNIIFYRITLKNSAMTHIGVYHSNGVTVWGLKIDTPASARNTDGFDPASSTNITVTNSYIRDGDDDIALKAGGAPYPT